MTASELPLPPSPLRAHLYMPRRAINQYLALSFDALDIYPWCKRMNYAEINFLPYGFFLFSVSD